MAPPVVSSSRQDPDAPAGWGEYQPSPVSAVLEPAEQAALSELWRLLGATPGREDGRSLLVGALALLEKLWDTIQSYPSLLEGKAGDALHRNLPALADALSHFDPATVEVFRPTRAALCRAFLQSKLNFCRLLGLVVDAMLRDEPEAPGIRHAVERIRTSAVCNIMAEDLLRMIAADEAVSADVRRKATRVLVPMWEHHACQVVPRLFPVLDSVWQTKAHVTVSYGSLTGFSEIISYLSKGCDPVFIECFSRDSVTEDEELALQEFVFNVRWEHLQQVQEHMRDQRWVAVDAETVAKVLGVPVSRLKAETCTCEDMILTFREREAMAAHRRALDLPGPKRTAEQLLMTFLLEQADEGDIASCEPGSNAGSPGGAGGA
jgi:hypothetical protein